MLTDLMIHLLFKNKKKTEAKNTKNKQKKEKKNLTHTHTVGTAPQTKRKS